MNASRFRAVLRTLVEHQVDFILVGGVAAAEIRRRKSETAG
jgi:hypothetical protein